MADNTSQANLKEQLEKARNEKQEILGQIDSLKGRTIKGCLIIIGFTLVSFWIMSAITLRDAPSNVKQLMIWIPFIIFTIPFCIILIVLMNKQRNQLEDKSYSATAEISRLEREMEQINIQEQLKKGEQEQHKLENQLNEKQDYFKYLQTFCSLFACLGTKNTSAILKPATEAVELASKALAAKKAQNATLRNKRRGY